MTERWETTRKSGIIIVPLELLEKIDRNRDELSRDEFIDLCIDNLLERGDAAAFSTKAKDVEAPISRSEFEDFKKGIKDLQRAYIDFLINYALEPLEKASPEEQERFKERMTSLLER